MEVSSSYEANSSSSRNGSDNDNINNENNHHQHSAELVSSILNNLMHSAASSATPLKHNNDNINIVKDIKNNNNEAMIITTSATSTYTGGDITTTVVESATKEEGRVGDEDENSTLPTTTTIQQPFPVPRKRGRPPKNPVLHAQKLQERLEKQLHQLATPKQPRQPRLKIVKESNTSSSSYNGGASSSSSLLTTPSKISEGGIQCSICKGYYESDRFQDHYNWELLRIESNIIESPPSPPPSSSSLENDDSQQQQSPSLLLLRPKRLSSINAMKNITEANSPNHHHNQQQQAAPVSIHDSILQSISNIRNKRSTRTTKNQQSSSNNSRYPLRLSTSSSPPLSPYQLQTPSNSFTPHHQSHHRQEEQRQCIVCNKYISGSFLHFQLHVEQCLNPNGTGPSPTVAQLAPTKRGRKKKVVDPPQPVIDTVGVEINGVVEGDDYSPPESDDEPEEDHNFPSDVETYTIGGITRIRTVSLLPNQSYEGIYFHKGEAARAHQNGDEDGELDVEQDDTVEFGATQYTEDDIKNRNTINNNNNNHDDNDTNMNTPTSTTSTTTTTSNNSTTSNHNHNNHFSRHLNQNVNIVNSILKGTPLTGEIAGNHQLIVDALKERIKEQEEQIKAIPSCLVCLEPYKAPLTSIKCWHVHCEQCWFNTLSVKKWCPQCKVITTHSELRKVYL